MPELLEILVAVVNDRIAPKAGLVRRSLCSMGHLSC